MALGGRVLVLDSPANADSTANSLLYPFEMAVDRSRTLSGHIRVDGDHPAVSVGSAHPVTGGQPQILLDGSPVASTLSHGSGTVTVVGFGSLFSDAAMGVTGDVVPDERLRAVFELQFDLLRQIVAGPESLPEEGPARYTAGEGKASSY
mgnify:CR=1 FL=1